jgi:hypothetical protein
MNKAKAKTPPAAQSSSDRFQNALLRLVLEQPKMVSFNKGVLQIRNPVLFVSNGVFHEYFPGAQHYRSFLRQLYNYNWKKMAAAPAAAAAGAGNVSTGACYYANPYLEGEEDPHCLLGMKPRKRISAGRNKKKKNLLPLVDLAAAGGTKIAKGSSPASVATPKRKHSEVASSCVLPGKMAIQTTSKSGNSGSSMVEAHSKEETLEPQQVAHPPKAKDIKEETSMEGDASNLICSSIMDWNDLPGLLERKKLRCPPILDLTKRLFTSAPSTPVYENQTHNKAHLSITCSAPHMNRLIQDALTTTTITTSTSSSSTSTTSSTTTTDDSQGGIEESSSSKYVSMLFATTSTTTEWDLLPLVLEGGDCTVTGEDWLFSSSSSLYEGRGNFDVGASLCCIDNCDDAGWEDQFVLC